MFIIAQLVFIVILIAIFFMLYLNERVSLKNIMPKAVMEEYWDGKERRRHFRFKHALELHYEIRKNSLANSATTIDISEGGAKLLLAEKLTKAAMVELKLLLPGSKKAIDLQSEVVWAEEVFQKDPAQRRMFHAGVRFLPLTGPASHILSDYLRNLSSGNE